ncbi:MAG: ATP-binding cassette domain-containing protein [Deltaproteobacteria bacterium]|nr:ATP-binding cassette domain-containing protein [Deltaproteobacteria bacterium]
MTESRVMIRCERLSKMYGPNRAVNDISFDVRSGEILGFLGPNGAGKTTTMKMITCFLAPTSGRIEVAGHDAQAHSLEVRRNIGYLPEDTPLYRDMTVLEYLEYAMELRGVPHRDRRPRIKKIGEVTGVLAVLGRQIGELSKGFRQRVGLTQAIVHDPAILILDEPTSGLDPNQIVEIRALIKELGREKTVILSTHILPEVTATCDRVVIISDGKLVADGRPEDLVARERGNKYRLLLESDGGEPDAAVQAKLRALEGVREVSQETSESGTAQFAVVSDGGRDLRRDLFRCVVDNKWPLLELERREASLEEVFGKLTRSDAGAAPKGPLARTEKAA